MKANSKSSILDQCKIFLNKTSGLAEDMSQRIMYSILPHLADPSQVALTQGVVDYKALRAAVEGRKRMIQYGVPSVINELENANDTSYYRRAKKLMESNQYGLAMDIAVEAFSKADIWYTSYGGKPWEEIAKTLRQLIRLDKTLDGIKAQPNRDHEKEVQVMRDIIVLMNIFDGLAHNSASIMNNLSDRELAEKTKSPSGQQSGEARKRLRRLMDAKELDSPAEVYKLIEPTLKDSGDINKFKDWTSRMHRSDDFRRQDNTVALKLFVIYLRKALIYSRGRINQLRDETIKTKFEKLKHHLNSVSSDVIVYELAGNFETIVVEIHVIAQEFADNLDNFIEQYPEFEKARPELEQFIKPYEAKAIQIYDNLAAINQYANDNIDPIDVKTKAEKMIPLINSFSYLMDSI